MDFGPLFGTGQPLHMRLAQSPLLWGSEGFSKDFKESSESKGAHPSSQPESSNGAVLKMPSPTGDRGFESISLHRRVHCEPDFLDQGAEINDFDKTLPACFVHCAEEDQERRVVRSALKRR